MTSGKRSALALTIGSMVILTGKRLVRFREFITRFNRSQKGGRENRKTCPWEARATLAIGAYNAATKSIKVASSYFPPRLTGLFFMQPLRDDESKSPGAGWMHCPTDETCRMIVVEGKFKYVKDDRGTGSQGLTVTRCPNACVFGGIAFCRRFAENGDSGKSG
jgi:hypothetical protein